MLSSNNRKIAPAVVTSILLAVFAGLNAYLPNYVETEFNKTLPLEERVAITEAAIKRFSTSDSIDSKVVIEILEADKQAEISTDKQVRLALESFGGASNVLIWLLLLHFLALIMLVPIGKKN